MKTPGGRDDSSDDPLEAYDYELPETRIAASPAAERSASRLLVHDRSTGRTQHLRFGEIGSHLAPQDLLIANDVRVIPARLRAKRSSGGAVEVLLHPTGRVPEPDEGPAPAFRGQAMLRPSARIRAGETLLLENGCALVVEDEAGADLRVVRSEAALEQLLAGGQLPLPPYIEREGAPTEEDTERYQTIFAREGGAIAAPTAGLHFTPELVQDLAAQGVELATLRLFVGPGTFLPVRTARLSEHRMHEEAYLVPEATRHKIAECRRRGGRVVAIGTTTTRALESASDADGVPRSGPGRTELMIRPPYEFRCVDALLTNFHLPRSTLLALVSAFAGRERILGLYREAIAQGYRFYSYGDAMLLL